MDGDADVSQVDEPEGLVEAEAGEEVSWRVVSECGVAYAATQDVEYGGGQDADQACSFHYFVLWRA